MLGPLVQRAQRTQLWHPSPRSCLSKLFADLPQRYIILLEDTNAVGVARTHESDSEGSESGTDVSHWGSGRPPGTVSFSGLLNVLDAVASCEGRIPIITMNHTAGLGDALIRPGRVDKKVEFQPTDQSMARQLFSIVFQQPEAEVGDPEVRSENNKAALQLAEQYRQLFADVCEPAKHAVLVCIIRPSGPPVIRERVTAFLTLLEACPRRCIKNDRSSSCVDRALNQS